MSPVEKELYSLIAELLTYEDGEEVLSRLLAEAEASVEAGDGLPPVFGYR
jgi:hypothetical protein